MSVAGTEIGIPPIGQLPIGSSAGSVGISSTDIAILLFLVLYAEEYSHLQDSFRSVIVICITGHLIGMISIPVHGGNTIC